MNSGTELERNRGRKWPLVWLSVAIVVAMAATACVPPGEPVDGPDPELLALLEDPDFVAQFGDDDEQRAEIIAAVRDALENGGEVDLEELQRATAEKADHDQQVEDDNAAQLAADEATAQAETERLDGLNTGPTVDEIAATQGDGSEDYSYLKPDHWSGVEGYDQAIADHNKVISATDARVAQDIKDLLADGTLPGAVKDDPSWVPDWGNDDEIYRTAWATQLHELAVLPPVGACLNRAGGRWAPTDPNLRPGTIYTPQQNTFSKPDGSTDFLGDLKTTVITSATWAEFTDNPLVEYKDMKHLIVQGHLGNLDTMPGQLTTTSIQQAIRARLTVRMPNGFVSQPAMHPWAWNGPIFSGDVKVDCYKNDYGLATGEPIRRAMFTAYIPWTPDIHWAESAAGLSPTQTLDEPGFQVRAEVTEQNWNPTYFFGADLRSVYLGPSPLGYNSTFTGGGLGLGLSKGLVTDTNGVGGDDLESIIRTPVSNAITSGLSGLDGTSQWAIGNNGANWGWLGYHINNSNPTTPNVDINWDPTKIGSANDDEYRLKGSVSMDDWKIEGYANLALFGLVPCYFTMKVDWSASIYAAIDIHNTAPTILQPDLEIGPIGLNIHNMYFQSLPLGCNLGYLIKFTESLVDQLNVHILPIVNQALENQIEVQPAVDNVLPATIPIGGGQNMNALFTGFNDTCPPYLCNGTHAGDMAMNWAGLQATGDIRFTDTKSAGAARRFPASYSPTTAAKADARVRQFYNGQNELSDISVWANPTVINQALRVIAEQGRLDINVDHDTPVTAKSPPIYLAEPPSEDKPLSVFLPHLEIDQPGANLFALDAYIALGVGFDSGTRKLVPADVSPTDPALRVNLITLECENVLWATCHGIPTALGDVLNYAANSILDPLLENSVGEVVVPETGTLDLYTFKVVNEDGHLGIRASIGAPSFYIWGSMNPSTYNFDTYNEGLPGTGPISYQWTITDLVSGANVLTYTGPNHQYMGLDTTALTPQNIPPFFKIRKAKATVIASRDGSSYTDTHQVQVVEPL